jgi:hypothetical protein
MASIAAKPRRRKPQTGAAGGGGRDRAQIADVDPGAVVRPRAKELLEGNNQNKCEMLTKMVPTARKIISGALLQFEQTWALLQCPITLR